MERLRRRTIRQGAETVPSRREMTMKQRQNEGKTPDPGIQLHAGCKAAPRRPYVAPVLVEYGTIAKLTQGSKTRSNDGVNTKKLRSCL